MITSTKYYVFTLSSQPSCLELVPVELSFLQIDASEIYQAMRVTHEVRSLYGVLIIPLYLGQFYWPWIMCE